MADNTEYMRTYRARERGSISKWRKKWLKNRYAEYHKKYLQDNLHKNRASQAVFRAVQSGRLVKGSCQDCGTEDVCGWHLEGYEDPLNVTWMCRRCYSKLKREG